MQRIVSKLLPPVLKVTGPLVTAVHRNHTELVALKVLVGSLISDVELALLPLTLPLAPGSATADPKLSFAGGGPGVKASVTRMSSRYHPSFITEPSETNRNLKVWVPPMNVSR